MSERGLLLASLKFSAERLFAVSKTFEAVSACQLLDELLDRRTITNTDMRAIRELAREARA